MLFTLTTDQMNPTITCPASRTVNTNVVTWSDPAAQDDLDTTLQVSCNPASGSTFAAGPNTVTCTATDDATNSAMCTFSVTVGM